MKEIKKVLPFFIILLAVAFAGIYWMAKAETAKTEEPELIEDIRDIPVTCPVTDNDLKVSEDSAVRISDEEAGGMGVLAGGAYVLTGQINKTVEIDAHDEIVHLILDNADIRTYDGPAIHVRSAAKVIITAFDGTDNTLADCAYHSEKDTYAAIYSGADVTLNGTGKLTITGFSKDAVYTAGFFKVLNTDLRLKSKRYAINADDGMLLMPSVMIAEAEKTGLKSGIHNKTEKGTIYILGGDNTVIAGNTAIMSGRDLYVGECNLSLNAVVADVYTEGKQYYTGDSL